jgi:hypothetical protein
MERVERRSESGPKPERIRISVSSFVHHVRVKETGETFQLVQLNEDYLAKTGQRKYQAMGGAVKMTPAGMQKLVDSYGAEFGRPDRPAEENDDARFFINVAPDKKQETLDAILAGFSQLNSEEFEDDVLREALEDIEKALGPLTSLERASMSTEYEGAVSPIRWETKTSERDTGGQSERIFHLFELEVPEALAVRLKESDVLRVVREQDVRDMQKATQEGVPGAPLQDGGTMVENIFPEAYFPDA